MGHARVFVIGDGNAVLKSKLGCESLGIDAGLFTRGLPSLSNIIRLLIARERETRPKSTGRPVMDMHDGPRPRFSVRGDIGSRNVVVFVRECRV